MDAQPKPVFRVDRSGAPGLTYEQTRGARFETPTRGVRIVRALDAGPFEAVDVALAVACDDAAVTDLAAARLWNLPLPPWLADPDGSPSVAVPTGRAQMRRPGVRGRRLALPADHVTEIDGRPVTTAGRTWLDCAALVPEAHLVAMADAGLARGLVTMTELTGLLHWGFRRRGVARARRALPLVDPRSASPGESVTRVLLVRERLPHPECNIDVIVNGEWLATVDIAWRRFRVAVEYDGLDHLQEQRRRSDARRRNLLQRGGWVVITATADDHRQPWMLAQHVRSALWSRGWHPGRG